MGVVDGGRPDRRIERDDRPGASIDATLEAPWWVRNPTVPRACAQSPDAPPGFLRMNPPWRDPEPTSGHQQRRAEGPNMRVVGPKGPGMYAG